MSHYSSDPDWALYEIVHRVPRKRDAVWTLEEAHHAADEWSDNNGRFVEYVKPTGRHYVFWARKP